MTKRRQQVSATPADQALFLSDSCCCVCHNHAVGVQVHHLDSDHSNNDLDNLAALCAHHHDQATREGGLTRKLSEGVIRLYREHWYAVVNARREREGSGPPGRSRSGRSGKASREKLSPEKSLLDALAIHEVRKIECELGQEPENWARSLRLMKPLMFYAERYDASVGQSILSAVDVLVSKSHHGADAFIASAISSVVYAALPLPNLLSPEPRRRTALELRVLEFGAAIGFELAYRNIKKSHTHSLGVVDAGAEPLWAILRYAILNRNADLSARVSQYFDQLERLASERALPDAARWLAYQRADALDIAQEGPRPPDDLEEKIWAEMETARARALNPESG